MNVLLLCGVCAKENEKEVMAHSRGGADVAANIFQQKLISGFQEIDCGFTVLSAPFIGAYPMGSDIAVFRGFSDDSAVCTYVNFNNIWGIRNFSRAASLKRALKPFIELNDSEKLIVVYCPHTPFLEAAVYAKRKDPRIRICLYVPDLPQYMNLNANRSRIYDFLKKYDVAVMMKLMEQVDSYVLLTEPMKDLLPVGNKPYRVIEGIVADWQDTACGEIQEEKEKYIVYTGKMNKKFGVKDLVDAFGLITDPDCRLVLCGRGDCDEYAAEAGRKDQRIMVLGQVTPQEARQWQNRAAVLVNPRPGGEDFVPYSFPSKNIEYLLTGRPVVAYLLPGMPECYSGFIHLIDSQKDAVEGVAEAIYRALTEPKQESIGFCDYAKEKLGARCVVQELIDISL